MRNYIDILIDFHKSLQDDLTKKNKEISNFSDKFIVWIVGLSVGAIALLFASIDKNEALFPMVSIRFVLTLFVISIVTGVLGRGLSVITSYWGFQLMSDFITDLRLNEIRYFQRELKGDETAEQIYGYLQIDFDAEFPQIIENLKGLDVVGVNNYNEQVRRFYIDFAKSKQKDWDLANNVINNSMVKSFGFKDNYFTKMKKEKNAVIELKV